MANKELFGNSEQLDTISRQAAINAICEDGTQLERQGQYTMTMAERKQRDADILDALPSAKPVAKDTNIPITDTISRQAALDALYDWSEHSMTDAEAWHIRQVIGDIKSMPSAQQWIPWNSGRFPKESGYYTVTAYDGATKRVTHAKYQKRLKRWELTGARAYWRVLAWMEKPELYKEHDDD